MMVAEVMERWPVSVGVFNRRRMACPGCVMAPFMTVAEAAISYGLSPEELEADLVEAMEDRAAGAGREEPGR
jgi:hybrid cluster-associated redox disulfide protein